jgi:hypothetical protein
MMFGSGGGWGIGTGSLHSFGVLLGSMVKKPGVVDGNIEVRETCISRSVSTTTRSTVHPPPVSHVVSSRWSKAPTN